MRFRSDTKGAAAIEFAMIAPVLIAMMFGALVFAMAFWTKSGLQEVSERTARCTAIKSLLCATVTTGCDSGVAAICYAETLAKQLGITNLQAGEIVVNTANIVGGTSLTTVTIVHLFSMAGYTFSITAVSSFPNNV